MGDDQERVLGPGAEGDIEHPEVIPAELRADGVREEQPAEQPHVPAPEHPEDGQK